jgi:hypothetical protein
VFVPLSSGLEAKTGVALVTHLHARDIMDLDKLARHWMRPIHAAILVPDPFNAVRGAVVTVVFGTAV